MRRTSALVIGAGQAGLAMSHCLGRRGIDHVVLERGRVGERWHSERWDSLRLLTPNWMSRLPGWCYGGNDPDGYMTAEDVSRYLEGYALSFGAPVESGTTVHSVEPCTGGYRVATSCGIWQAQAVVVATGHCDIPSIPSMAQRLPASIHQVTPSDYRNPSSIPEGGVLVVGASASGVQIAEELHRAGHPATIAVGRHTRLPRLYRGRDIMWWMDQAGVLNDARPSDADQQRLLSQPSMQLVGHPDRRSIDLGTLHDQGVRIVGRAMSIEGTVVRLQEDLVETVQAAQLRLDRLLARLNAYAGLNGPSEDVDAARPLTFAPSPTTLDLRAEGIRTIVWATGFNRDYRWIKVPVLDGSGEVVQRAGITSAPGLYVMGLRFMRRRNSSFLDGVGADAELLADDIHGRLTANCRIAA
jgi:putative flavoprotein involved in K+ transport